MDSSVPEDDPRYFDQARVYKDMGRRIFEDIKEGFILRSAVF